MKRIFYYLMSFVALTLFSVTGMKAIGNPFQKGVLDVPYYCNFTNVDEFNQWTVIDGNSDGFTWMGYTGKASYFCYLGDADDWMITPSISLVQGCKYILKFNVMPFGGNGNAMLVSYGKGVTVADQVNQIGTVSSTASAVELKFTAIETGVFNIGMHLVLPAGSYGAGCELSKVSLEADVTNDLEAVSISGKFHPNQGREYIYGVKIRNKGKNVQTGFEARILNEQGDVLAAKVCNENLSAAAEITVDVPWTPLSSGQMAISGGVYIGNDENRMNDISPLHDVDINPQGSSEWVEIGESLKQSSEMPVNFYYKAGGVQTIYLASEIGIQKGLIERIEYMYNNKMLNDLEKPVKIYMANTSLQNSKDGFLQKENMTLVYDGNVTISKGDSRVIIDLNNTFVYTGGNLCITTVRKMDVDAYGSISAKVTTDNVVGGRTRTYGSADNEFVFMNGEFCDEVSDIGIFIETVGQASIKGTVKDEVGNPLSGVSVKINSLGFNEVTDVDGNFEFGFVSDGTYIVEASKFGYSDFIKEISVALQQTVLDIDLVTRPVFEVSGLVVDIDGNPAGGVNIVINGYNSYEGITSEDGAFSFKSVYASNDYSITALGGKFNTYIASFNVVDQNVKLPDIELSDALNPSFNLKTMVSDQKVVLSWEPPHDKMLFRYDNGLVAGDFTTTYENATVVFGTAYRTPTMVNSVCWYLTADGGPHENVNVFVFDLDGNGKPTSSILYRKDDVVNTDDRWCTFEFEKPIYAPNGFLVGLSYEGKLGLAMDNGNDLQWPFRENTHYYSFFGYDLGFLALAKNEKNGNFMIRANGVPVGNDIVLTSKMERALNSYKVYRFIDGQSEDLWLDLTAENNVVETAFSDNSWSDAGSDLYRYAVKAVYSGNKLSEAVISDVIDYKKVCNVGLNVTTKNTPDNESKGAIVTMECIDKDGSGVITAIADDNGQVYFENLKRGRYEFSVELDGFKSFLSENNDFTSKHDFKVDVQLEENIVNPFSLEIVDGSDEYEKILNWNGSENVFDDFEGHRDFELNSSGDNKWQYLFMNKSRVYAILGYDFPNIWLPTAFMVFNPSQTTPALQAQEAAAFSGEKYLVSFSKQEPPSNDFIISDELNFNKDFKVSFMAKSYNDMHGLARFKVGYSVSGMQASDFKNWVSSGEYVEAPASEWTYFEYTIPADAKYVTVNCISDNATAFMLDDLFIGLELDSRSFTNYEVYLDGNKIGITDKTSYVLSNLTKGKHVAGVKAVYSSGISEMTVIDFEVDGVGVNNIESGCYSIYPNPVSGSKFTIVSGIDEVDCVEVYDSTGRMLFSKNGFDDDFGGDITVSTDNLVNGIYFVKVMGADTKVMKIMVKK